MELPHEAEYSLEDMNQVYLLSKFDVSSFSKTRDFQTGHFAETSTSRDRCFIFFCNEDRVRISKTKWFSKISEGNKEKGPEQAKVFSGSMNHFMKNAKSFKFLQTNLVKFCKFNSLPSFV